MAAVGQHAYVQQKNRTRNGEDLLRPSALHSVESLTQHGPAWCSEIYMDNPLYVYNKEKFYREQLCSYRTRPIFKDSLLPVIVTEKPFFSFMDQKYHLFFPN